MRTGLKLGLASALLALSAGVPWVLQHHARLELRARRDVLEQQASRLSLSVEENGRLSNLVAQAKDSPPLTEEQLRELMRLRNEKRLLAEQTNRLARLLEEDQLKTPLAAGASVPGQLSSDEIVTALSAEMTEAMKRILPALPPALQKYALAHTNQTPGSFSELQDYFPLVAGRKMAGLQTFAFVREEHLRQDEALTLPPGDALLLRGDAGRRSADGRPGEGSTVRVYGFSDGRVVEVSSEDGRFDDWEKQHMNSAPAGTEEKIYLESEENARERARMVEDGASLGISAEDASRFFDRFKQEEKILGPRFSEMRKNLTGSPEEQQRQMQAAIEQELTKLAAETLGDKGPALARKLVEGK